MNPKLYARRRRRNSFFLILSVAAAGFGIVMLGLILGTLFYEGIGGFSPKIFTEITPPPGENGGLANAIFGSFLMSGIAVVAGTPIGILAGTYLAEYGRYTYLASIVRFVNDILLSAPSILIGLFIYQLLVIPMRGFSAWAGAAALMIIVIPVVVRTTENMLLLVPGGLREAAAALGAPQSKVIRAVTWKAAQAGMITGVLLATARILGETAPLLFTALSSQFENYDLGQPMANLPVVIFQFANSPFEDWQRLAWAGALLITLTVLSLSILARLLESKNRGQN